jgi:hypothetical protein
MRTHVSVIPGLAKALLRAVHERQRAGRLFGTRTIAAGDADNVARINAVWIAMDELTRLCSEEWHVKFTTLYDFNPAEAAARYEELIRKAGDK